MEVIKVIAASILSFIMMMATIMVAGWIWISNAYGKTISQDNILKICKEYGYDNCKLVKAIAWVETNNKPGDYNPELSGSYGLMQIQCDTARVVNFKRDCKQLYKARTNIKVGIDYLKYLVKVHKPVEIKSLIAAWNSGTPIICENWNKGKCYPGQFINHDYVRDVHDHYIYLGGDPKWNPQLKLSSLKSKVIQLPETTYTTWLETSHRCHKTMMNLKWLSPMKSKDSCMQKSYPFTIEF